MPHFYFDVRAGTEVLSDPDGFELDSLEGAEQEATQTALALGRDWLPRTREVCVEVRDEWRHLRLILSVALRVKRLD
ncbi:hypothetical protein [Microvirga sp. VF16]|uniref:DUF6894 family protein n=1 Tax=Microvirga sp. VF16 TaxID=2807101 RepID=UPI00193CA873|nr:hypothetical protein [Microvirga sp. VF16]QRM29102.1 hypothetical protein JO965_23455 [Microvirga sp. VF16]QRM34331.1 hypothetical protein JO965_34525 [Microvirga sp. VF16]